SMDRSNRRQFLVSSVGLGVAAMGVMSVTAGVDEKDSAKKRSKKGDKNRNNENSEEVSAPDDLMREHRLLNRILLIYNTKRATAHPRNEEITTQVCHQSAELVRPLVEDAVVSAKEC